MSALPFNSHRLAFTSGIVLTLFIQIKFLSEQKTDADPIMSLSQQLRKANPGKTALRERKYGDSACIEEQLKIRWQLQPRACHVSGSN